MRTEESPGSFVAVAILLASAWVSAGIWLAGKTEPMIGHRAGDGEMIFHHVKAVHRVLRLAHPAPRSEPANRSEIAFAAIQEIAVEREDDVGLVELRHEPGVVAEADLGRKALRLAQERVVNAPAHARELLLQFGPQPVTRRRMRFLNEEGQAGAAVRRHLWAQLGEIFFKLRAARKLVLPNESLRARGIVEIEQRSLGEGIGLAVAVGMKWIAFDLDRTAVDRRHHQRHRAVTPRHRGRIVKFLARDGPFRALREGDEVHLRFAAAAQAEPGQRHRRAHQSEETAARNFVHLHLLRAGGEFPFQPIAEFGRVAQLAEAAPVLLPGLVGRWVLQDALHCNPPRKSAFQADSADGLPAGRLIIQQAGSPLAESGKMPDFRFSAAINPLIGGTPGNLMAD